MEGWTTLVLLTLLGFSAVLFSLGVMGMYIVNTLFQSKTLPAFVIRRAITDDAAETAAETQP